MDNFDLRKYLAEGRLLKEEYNLPDSDSNTDKYVNKHWDISTCNTSMLQITK